MSRFCPATSKMNMGKNSVAIGQSFLFNMLFRDCNWPGHARRTRNRWSSKLGNVNNSELKTKTQALAKKLFH